ncbi:LTA synthase family protein [Arthrobacter sp. zg-Y820]|uniref:LTA synthase family protein n=1 Tax=unclassified Arthrobacter TaxID=235627 RepID=UPI001E589417|nr:MULTISPECIES: LTA synthase family protein [unclassified Arthrobacter]MCC9197585.1 LTA synthase family protein [Arthrobacter sp. zg-Y820]MDK1280452.1 LTA synthase family protein [Arthrobacter sp. zg.Y820]MDK1361968.1 LTA synthase family protein [Arthrobacter sp. zg-Y1219]WIB10904.1 LTA synthase family protein [Arthrobacter sp. zg-Y820]
MSGRILNATRRVAVAMGQILVYVLIWAGLALLIAAVGIRFYWGEISVNQMLLNLVSVEIDGGGGAIVWAGILGIGVAPVLITAAIALWHQSRGRKRRRNGDDMRPRHAPWLVRTVSAVLVGAVVVGGTTAFTTTVGMGDYLKAANSPYNVGDYYVEPTITGDGAKRNLVLIYLESGEATLADDQLFEKDAFAPLKEATDAADGWQSVDNFQQYNGGGWTMAGLVSTQCGLPLKGTGSAGSSGAREVDEDGDTYLGGSTCVGDVLEEHGYNNVFLGGANSSFAAKDTFLSSHGYSEVKGLADWRAAGEPEESFRSDWGLSDERLMAQAKDRIDQLHAEAEQTGRPFNLSMLTLDTHEPVHIYDYCNVDTQNKVTSAFSCSLTQVAGFVDHMKEKGYLEDTAVVIMGDHLKHMSAGDAFHEQLDHHGNRTIFNRIWVPGGENSIELRSGGDQLNMYPTILEAVGLTLKNHEAGLGVSAFAPAVPEGSAQAMEPEAYAELLESLSPQFYAEAWAGQDPAQ